MLSEGPGRGLISGQGHFEHVQSGETALAAAGADDIGDVLSRCESLRERLRGVDAVLA